MFKLGEQNVECKKTQLSFKDIQLWLASMQQILADIQLNVPKNEVHQETRLTRGYATFARLYTTFIREFATLHTENSTQVNTRFTLGNTTNEANHL